MNSIDAKKLTSEVAARHGVVIREDDPAMALVTMSEIVLEEALRKAEVRLSTVLAEAENGQRRLQQGAVLWVQEEIGRAGNALRAQIQRDIDGAAAGEVYSAAKLRNAVLCTGAFN